MAQRRALIEATAQAMEIASTPGGEVGGKLDQIASLFVNLQRDQITGSPRSLADVVLMRKIEKRIARGWQNTTPFRQQAAGRRSASFQSLMCCA